MKKNAILLFFLLLHNLSFTQPLPSLMPVVYDPSLTGYYFLSSNYAGQTFFMILDHSGTPVYYKPMQPGHTIAYNFSLQPNKLISYSGEGKYFFMDSTFKIVDSVECKNIYNTDPHDMRLLPNGHYLLLGADTARMDLSKYPRYNEDGALVKRGVIQELDSKRNVAFEWRASDHFTIDDGDSFFVGKIFGMVDVEHVNAVEMDNDGNILLSSHNFDEITKISRTDGSIIWRLGGKRNQFKFVNMPADSKGSPILFYGQHDIRRISNGHITLFDGGHHTTSHGARALEFELDEANKIATLRWSYVYDSSVQSMGHGNVQRLPNSNTLINYGGVSNGLIFVVVDSTGRKLFQLSSVNHLDSYRSFYYPSLSWQVYRPQITCFISNGLTYLDAGAGYKQYKWNTGDTTQIIPVSATGNYYVFVPYGDGGYVSSEKFNANGGLPSCPADTRKRQEK